MVKFVKKALAITLSAVMIATVAPVTGYAAPETEDILSPDSVFVKGVGTKGLESMTLEAQKTLYGRIDQAATNFMKSTTDLEPIPLGGNDEITYVVEKIRYNDLSLTLDQACQALCAYDYDHPAYYWIDNTVWSTDEHLYLCTVSEYASVETRADINKMVTDGVKGYAKLADMVDDTLDKIAVIHDTILEDIDYAYSEQLIEDRWAHSVHGVFDKQYDSAVCEGYADAFALMMNYLGIPNYYIVGEADLNGTGDGMGHAWNAVSDDGGKTYMYMDLTWDDSSNGYYHKYFGMPQADFESTHFAFLPTNSGIKWLYPIDNLKINSTLDGQYYVKSNCDCRNDVTDAYIDRMYTAASRFERNTLFLGEQYSDLQRVSQYFGKENCQYFQVTYDNKPHLIGILGAGMPTIDISSAQIQLTETEYPYTGSAVEPQPVVSVNGVKLLKDLNYTVSYSNNIEKGDNTAIITVTAAKNSRFTGSLTTSFTISGNALTSDMVTLSAAQFTYNGESQKPTVTVKFGETVLTENTDYTVAYDNDTTSAGIKNVIVSGNGTEFKGTVTKTYEIKAASSNNNSSSGGGGSSGGGSGGGGGSSGGGGGGGSSGGGGGSSGGGGGGSASADTGVKKDPVSTNTVSNNTVSGNTVTGSNVSSNTVTDEDDDEDDDTDVTTFTIKKGKALFTYEISGKTVTLISATAKVKTVKIPNTVKIDGKTYKVTAISANVFKGNKKIRRLVIGSNVKVIGASAFEGCSKLKNITIKAKNLTKVEKKAFSGIPENAVIKIKGTAKQKAKAEKLISRSF